MRGMDGDIPTMLDPPEPIVIDFRVFLILPSFSGTKRLRYLVLKRPENRRERAKSGQADGPGSYEGRERHWKVVRKCGTNI